MANATDRNASVPALPAKPMFENYVQPGVMYREGDYPGAASHLAMPPESALRAHKGDLGEEHIPNLESKPNESGKVPFKNLKRGK